MIRELSFEIAKAVTTPGSRDDAGKSPLAAKEVEGPALDDDDSLEARGALLSSKDTTAFRVLVAHGNYLAQDRVEIQYAVKEAARRMSAPRKEDWALLRRTGRYLTGAPRLVDRHKFQHLPGKFDTFSDSDWAGCKTTKRSTSGGSPCLAPTASRRGQRLKRRSPYRQLRPSCTPCSRLQLRRRAS